MKCLETKFEEYIENVKKNNYHKYLSKKLNSFGSNIDNLNHIIFYGKKGIGKYSQVLNFIKKFSESGLKYERKINYKYNNKYEYTFKISDIHFEIDAEMLGCNAKLVFNDLFYHILDVSDTWQRKTNIIVVKNFHKINSDLLDIFYSYMHTLYHKNLKLVFILVTENISFIPNNIIDKCSIVSLNEPRIKNIKKNTVGKFENLKDIKLGLEKTDINIKSQMVNVIYENIVNYEEINFLMFRDNIYDLFIYNVDIENVVYCIISELIKNGYLKENLNVILNDIYLFLRYYNNNYRPIYHVELIFFKLIKIIHNIKT